MTVTNLIRIIIFLFLVISVKCLPERDNPIDPKSPYTHINKITGRIITKVGNPIVDALITLKFINSTQEISTISKTNGYYDLEYIYAILLGDTATISVSKTGFMMEQQKFKVIFNRNDTFNFMLDAIPQFSAESITSYHEASFYPGDIYNLRLSVKVNDADGPGDVDSVYIVIPVFSMVQTMEYSPGDIYKLTIPENVFPDSALEDLIGNDCYFDVLSKTGLHTRSNYIRLNRVIYEIPQTIFPNGDTVSQNFTCIWQTCNFMYPFTYGVEIYLLPTNNIPQNVYRKNELPATDTTYMIPTSLTRGRYLWQVMIKDNFGNISKSYQSLFFVE